MQNLLKKKFIIFTGKGGVGKSTLTSAFALFAAKNNKKVCMVEVSYNEILSKIFNKPKVGHKETEVYPGIYAINVNKDETLREFVMTTVKLESVYKGIFKNRIFDALFNAMPGLSEMLLLGRINWMFSQRGHGWEKYDIVILDAPSTGQGISFFSTPKKVMESVPTGPIHKIAGDIAVILSDSSHTAINLITLPEDMPANEAIDMHKTIFLNLNLPMGKLIINRVVENPFSHTDDLIIKEKFANLADSTSDLLPVIEAMEWRKQQADLHKFYVEKLRQNIDPNPLIIPYIFQADFGMQQIEQISEIF